MRNRWQQSAGIVAPLKRGTPFIPRQLLFPFEKGLPKLTEMVNAGFSGQGQQINPGLSGELGDQFLDPTRGPVKNGVFYALMPDAS